MPAPDNITKLQAFLGLVNYYNLYILQLYKLRAPLNELLKKKIYIRTSMNERTHFFIKIYLSYFILERVDVGCV